MKKYSFDDIKPLLGSSYKLIGDPFGYYFTNVRPVMEADDESLVWIKKSANNADTIISQTKARMIICGSVINIEQYPNKCFIIVEEPRLTFLRIVNTLFTQKMEYGIHPSAIIHPEAKIHPDSFIGPLTYIGKSSIGEGSILFGNIHVYDNVNIGKNVIIHAGTVIGADGFGYHRNEEGEFEKFPHIGGVVIEDEVEIGANACIDRGGLGNTHIKYGAKIDNLVHIAHNVVVGQHSAVIAHAMVGGSTRIGDHSWVAPSVALLNGISIGNTVTIGMGAVVTKNVPDGETWTGLPAKPLNEFIELQRKLKKL